MKSRLFFAAAAALALFGGAMRAQASATLVVDNTAVTTSNNAICVAAPERDTGSVTIDRIRITSSRSTATSYTFVAKRTRDSTDHLQNLASCSLPECQSIFTVEGVMAGKVFDADGLNFVLPPGYRFYFYTDADIGSDHQTIEVYYSQN